EGDYRPGVDTDRVASLGAGALADITAALPAFDALITDYSSLVYDAALIPVPSLFLAPDLEQYAARRGFYGRYADVAGPDVATTWSELLPELDALFSSGEARAALTARAAALSDRVHAFRDGRNTWRVVEEILTRTERARP